ncbi:MAG: DUF1838 family protein [Chromatiales bacterium]|nr:DUF1838 family protein [Chromatiales bacterium]
MQRREFLAAAGGLVLAGNALARPSPAGGYDLSDPEQSLAAMLRLQSRLDDLDAPWWYFGRIYGMLEGQAPIPLVRFEGTEIIRITRTADGEFAATGVTTSFFQGFHDKALLESMVNPVTGRRVTVEPNLIGGTAVPAVYYSTRGARPGRVAPGDWPEDRLKLTWDHHEENLWMSLDRTYPPGIPQPAGESSVMRAREEDLHDRTRVFVPATFSSTYFAPWPRWMEMGDHPGYVIWHADGVKLDTVARMPAHFLGWMESRFPERLAAKPYQPPSS